MSFPLVGNKPPTIKPDDLIRTPSGRTASCIEIRPRGFRLLKDIVSGALFIMHVDELYLVRAAMPKPWPERVL